MWRPWSKSPVRIHNSSANNNNNLSCSTFKDIQKLCTDDSNSEPHLSRKPSVFHRVCVATSLVRSWSSSRLLLQSNSTETSSSSSSWDKTLPTTTTTPLLEPQQIAHDSRETFDDTAKKSEHEPETNEESPEKSEKTLTTSSEPEPNATTSASPPSISLPGTEKRIVVYFTSLRVVRRTFEDCRAVRSIIRGFRVSIDERDLSMDSGFMEELQGILGKTNKLTLPRVFIGGRYIGGVEEIRQLHETGELKKFVEGLPAVDPGVCDACGGHSFILCDECNGSHKLYTEKNGFRSCTACNENGLIRCPSCSCAPF